MNDEIQELGPEHRLVEAGRWLVAIAEAREIPKLLREIGRLRERAFRAVGEGTGRELDLDRFDEHYRHLLVWDRRENLLAGAYRVAGRALHELALRVRAALSRAPGSGARARPRVRSAGVPALFARARAPLAGDRGAARARAASPPALRRG
jgi:hypothetical protein